MSDLSQHIANLSPANLELLARRLANRNGQAAIKLSIPRRMNRSEVPLSFAQRRMWILHQLDPCTAAFNIPVSIRLQGPLDQSALERSLNELVRRHEILRTTYGEARGQPVQVIHEAAKLHLPVIDLSGVAPSERESRMRFLLAAEISKAFDLKRGPVLRCLLIGLEPEEHVLSVTVHHIAADGWSMNLLVREVGELYQSFSQNRRPSIAELPIQYADYAEWQGNWLVGDVLARQLEYWRKQLTGAPPVLELPTDKLRPAVLSHRGKELSVKLEKELAYSLKQYSQRAGVTMFMLMLTAFKVLLYRYTGQEDIVVGTNIANRNQGQIQNLIGFFVNNLVLRTDLSGSLTFQECLNRVREVTLEAFAHQDVPFEMLVDVLRPERVRNHTPLFQVMFLFQNSPPPVLAFNGLRVSILNVEGGTTSFDLTMVIEDSKLGLFVHLTYDTDLFVPVTINRMLQHYQQLLKAMVQTDRSIAEFALTTDEESDELVKSFNAELEETD